MTKEILEYVVNTQRDLISEMLEITDRAVLTEEEQAWREKAESLQSYAGQHLDLDAVEVKSEISDNN